MRTNPLAVMAIAIVAVLTMTLPSMGDVILFDDAMQNGANFWKEGGASASEPTDTPVSSGTAAIKVTCAEWQQAGISINQSVPTDSPIFEMQVNWAAGQGGGLTVRYGSGWTAISLNTDNNAYWTIDGEPGAYNFADGEWHTLQVDFAGLGATGAIKAFGVKAGGGGGVYTFDDVRFTTVPEPGSMALLALGALALARRRR